MPFQDQHGKAALPKLDEAGNVPVTMTAETTELQVLTYILRELREIRILQAQMLGIPATTIKPLPELQ